jgi:hypothetical protein
MKTTHTFKMDEAQANLIHKLAAGEAGALKNFIASAVECGDFERAQGLVCELRAVQSVFAQFNMGAKRTTAEATGKPLATEHPQR